MQRALIFPIGVIGLLALAACVLPRPVAQHIGTGRADFAQFCSGCHGAGGKGDGELAADLDTTPADLTQLSASNNGAFPGTRVMAQIWGYTGAHGGGDRVMPEFAALLDSPLVPYDGGDGISTPTPERLVELAEYLKTLQE